MFTSPLNAEEYRTLVDVKYRSGADAIKGWALRDLDGRTLGWHPHQSGSQHWAHREDALRAFVPDSRERRKFVLLGYDVIETTGLEDLTRLLRAARGDNSNTAKAVQP